MANSSVSLTQPEARKENKLSLRGYREHSYNQIKKQQQDGFTVLFKEEFPEMSKRPLPYSDRMLLPVNNFLKDFTHIEEDFREELTSNRAAIIPIEQALESAHMEENY